MMNENYHRERLLEKTLSVIRKNIDSGSIKTEVFSYDKAKGTDNAPDYIRVSVKKKEYDEQLDFIMNYFIENEWYEDCVTIKSYQEKLNKLQDEQNERTPTRPKAEPVKEEL